MRECQNRLHSPATNPAANEQSRDRPCVWIISCLLIFSAQNRLFLRAQIPGLIYAKIIAMRRSRLVLPVFISSLALGDAGFAASTEVPLRHDISVSEISGGDQANTHWNAGIGNDEFRRALETTLYRVGLLERARGEGRYGLQVELESIDQPDLGLSVTVTARVKYTLVEKTTGRQLFQECICGDYTIETWDGLWRPKRLQAASRGAVVQNTEELARRLFQLGAPQGRVSLAQ